MSLTAAHCPVCTVASARTVETAEPPYRVLRCRGCDLFYVDPLPDAADLRRHYSPDYYAEWITTQKERRRRMWTRRLDAIERMTAGRRLLDVGCGDGAFLQLAAANGWSVEGTEVSAAAAGLAARSLGGNVFQGEVWEAVFPQDSFDVVTLWHVLEHTSAPLRVLAEARRVLRRGGRLVIAVPNVDNRVMQAAYRIVRRRRLHLFSIRDKELHLLHFSIPSLKRTLERAGFACIEAGPDYGIVEPFKQLINGAAVVLSGCLNVQWYNSIRVVARRRDS